MNKKEYIDIQVTPYALPEVCEALYRNGVNDACVMKEDGKLHIRWEYKISRYCTENKQCSGDDPQIN